MKEYTTEEIFNELWKRIEFDANVSEELANESNELQSKIDKAIEYINEHKHLSMFADCTEPEEDWIYDLEIPANELLDILKGEDKE